MKFEPTFGRAVIRKMKTPTVMTKQGLEIPQQVFVEEDLNRGEIVADGGGIDPISGKALPAYKKGTVIWYSRFSATRLMDDKGETFYILAKDDIQAIEG